MIWRNTFSRASGKGMPSRLQVTLAVTRSMDKLDAASGRRADQSSLYRRFDTLPQKSRRS